MPKEPGVYLFLNSKDEVIYVGKAKDLKSRVSSYFSKSIPQGEKTKNLVNSISKIKYVVVNSEIESFLLEANLIKKYSPLYNVRFTDGKAYPFIRITIKEDYPKILTSRREEDKNSLYFGPYPNASAMKIVLRIARKIFPFQSSVHTSNRVCFYNHLSLCPCSETIATKEAKRAYRNTVKHIVNFFQGKTQKVLQDLEKERDIASRNEDFETASIVQKKISDILLVTTPVHKSFEYEVNPNLLEDQRLEEVKELVSVLQAHKISIKKLQRIECFDISNINGKQATGSMVVFVDGEKQTSFYRRFKIRSDTSGKPNDFLMMKEVLSRRLRHKEWAYPDLIIVDGGKGQVSYAFQAIKNSHLEIPVVGLAKKIETIITSDFRSIQLPNDSRAIKLLMRIRDEAHRFAITYHKKLRWAVLTE